MGTAIPKQIKRMCCGYPGEDDHILRRINYNIIDTEPHIYLGATVKNEKWVKNQDEKGERGEGGFKGHRDESAAG